MIRRQLFGPDGSWYRVLLIILALAGFSFYIVKNENYMLLLPLALGALAFGKYLFDVYSGE
ncbi:MAG: hypothetical protein JXQ87_13130 [Bacteroidia bacterium]